LCRRTAWGRNASGNGLVSSAASGDLYCRLNSSTPQSRVQWDGVAFTATVGKEDHPMLYVSWHGAAGYANWRSLRDGFAQCYDPNTWACDFTANGYRLPTSAEWEKAARGDGNQVPAGIDRVNGYGLYDVMGNAWEWCHDWYAHSYYSSSPYDNPTGPASGSHRVVSGGSWASSGSAMRVAGRRPSLPDLCRNVVGFRMVAGVR